MTLRRPILLVGLTGGIACGKSTVDGMFHQLGAHVIEADGIVHGLLERGGKAADAVIAAFGPIAAAPDGGVDRTALGAIVFSDPASRARLEAIVHPMVRREILHRIEALGAGEGSESRTPNGATIVIVDAALLVETNAAKSFHRLIVVTCSEEQQVERLAHSRAMSRNAALQRIRSQAATEEKARLADYLIENGGSLEETRRQVELVYRSLLGDYKSELAAGRLIEGSFSWV